MGAYTFLDGKKLKFWKAKLMSEQELLTTFPELKEYEYKLNELEAGTILFTNPKQGLFIKAKQGILQILEIQAENAKRMSTSDFLRGNNIQAGKHIRIKSVPMGTENFGTFHNFNLNKLFQ